MRYLEKTAWTTPSSYGGFSPEGDYCIYSHNRDSDILTESNWDYMIQELNAEAFDNGSYSDYEGKNESRPMVYHWSAGHWACGWVEHLMIRKNAPEDIKEKAEKILAKLDSYPVLDEDDFSEREYESAQKTWGYLSLHEKIKLCAESGISIFSARKNYIPEDDSGSIYDYCRG